MDACKYNPFAHFSLAYASGYDVRFEERPWTTQSPSFFLTWTTYGTWLPGDSRGWTEYRNGWQLPDPMKELEATARMTEDACRLSKQQRNAVEDQIGETCRHRSWHLHAVNCRSNHIHVVVSAFDTRPKKIRGDLKAWATRCLKERLDVNRDNWWSERGSIRFIYREDDLEAAILYVTEGQDWKHIEG